MRILIVDDDPLIGESLSRLLDRLGHETWLAADPAGALFALSTRAVDTVLVDWNMPGGGGRRVVDAVAAGEVPPAHMILITGLPGACLPPEAAGLPLLQKPFRVRELEQVLRTLVPSSK